MSFRNEISASVNRDCNFPSLQVQRQRPPQRPRPVLGQVGQGGRAGPRGVGPRGAGEERGERQRHVGAAGRLLRRPGPQRTPAGDPVPGAVTRGARGGRRRRGGLVGFASEQHVQFFFSETLWQISMRAGWPEMAGTPWK